MALKENYKDDILDVSVNTKRKYRMTENADGTISLDDETVYTQEGDSFGASDMNAVGAEVNGISGNLNGFKFYPTGTELVALVADDSFYKDANEKYVLADSPTGQTLLADTATYKALASTEDCRGEVGADTAIPFKSGINFDIFPNSVTISCSASGTGYLTNNASVTNLPTFGVYKKITQSYGGSYTDLLNPNTTIKEYDEEGNVTTTNKGKVSTFTHDLLDTTMYVSLELTGMQGYKSSAATISRTITLSKS